MAVTSSAVEASSKIKYLDGGSTTYNDIDPNADAEDVYLTVKKITSLQTRVGTNIYMNVVNELKDDEE